MFYERLKRLCFEQGISVSKMAVDLKISTTTVTGWKRGAKPQSAQVKKIAEYFKISTDELMDDAQPAAVASGVDLPDGGAADLMDIVKSQQASIQNFSESGKNYSESSKSIAESQKNMSEAQNNLSQAQNNMSEAAKSLAKSQDNLSESTKSLAKSQDKLAESNKNLSETAKDLAESNKNLAVRLSKSGNPKSR